jgi:hypothetical protein
MCPQQLLRLLRDICFRIIQYSLQRHLKLLMMQPLLLIFQLTIILTLRMIQF